MKNTSLGCVLIVMADGFEEVEMVTLLSGLRQAGLCAKSVGLTSGSVNGAHGIWLMPDLTLADLDPLPKTMSLSAVILPEGKPPSLRKLEIDPRVHRLLRQVVAQGGQVIVGPEAKRVLKLAGNGESNEALPSSSVILREPGQSPEAFTRELIHRLEPMPRV